MKVNEVHFNHDESSATSDAINIRINAGGTPVQAPEWRDGFPPLPAAYALAALSSQITIKARFSDGPHNGIRVIRALDGSLSHPRCDLLYRIVRILKVIILTLFGKVLLEVRERKIHFDASGKSALETFTVMSYNLKRRGVDIHNIKWIWQYKSKCKWLPYFSTWKNFSKTQHKLYIILDIPNGPWEQTLNVNNTQIPWADALDKSCVWAAGATNKDRAAELITKAINTRPNQSYTPYTIFGFNPPYQLTSYMNCLDSGSPFSLNCTDCADGVTTFANLLGCDLWEGRFFNMHTRKFLTLNGDPAVEADWVVWDWNYHEICWLGSMGQNEFIYDGCLQVDMDDNYNDLVHSARHPVKMRFGLDQPEDYRYRLIESGNGNLENTPRRRSVA